MKYAIDKDTINRINELKKEECVYLFTNESIEELINLNMHCIHQEEAYTIKNLKYPFKKNYKFAIIVPNCNNDHRRI